ncbi:hypothetical protein D9O50_14725 [Oxalobacteraceae bacterium CAVE-383]|nr:hypothetical protein D9O50_14725 [Oxalobacteraceae bacterium CAVE-383]
MLPRFPVPATTAPSPFPAGRIHYPGNDPNASRGAFSVRLKSAGAGAASAFSASSPLNNPLANPCLSRFKLLPTDTQAKREIQRHEDFKVFSALLCSANGIDALHNVLSGYSAKIDFQEIAARLNRTDLACLKTEIERIGSKRSLKEIAVSVHVCPGTTRPPAVVAHARLRLTSAAVNYLWNCHETGIFVRAGRFIPCGQHRETGNAAGDHIDGRYTVFLTLRGYSLKPLDRQISAGSSCKAVFSPHAVFAIGDMTANDADKSFNLTLTETARQKKALDLPF